MKIDFVKTLIAICISALLAYGCYELCSYENLQWVITVGAFLTFGVSFTFALGISSEQERSTTMLKALAWVAVIAELIVNGIFAFLEFSIPIYIIINGLILLIFTLIYNSIYRTKM